jgi:RES domain-containing protein
MRQRAFRVCRAIHEDLDGQGAKLVGGRWNSPGRAVAYLAQSVSLAVLENLVHMAKADFPVGYVVIEARIPSTVRMTLEEDLRNRFPGLTPQELGDRRLELGETAVLKVHSAVVPGEFNFLLNPAHRQFNRITVESPTPFEFDARLFGR